MLSLADRLRHDDPELVVTIIGTAEGLESRLVPARGYDLVLVPKVPLPRRPGPDLLRLPRRLREAVSVTSGAMRDRGAQVVVGFGGYVSVPAYLAARRHGIPIVVHEQNARPGIANRLGARLAAAVAVTFPGTALPSAVLTGMPLRREVASLDRAATRAQARAQLGLDAERPTLLVTGGSLGAQGINEVVVAAAPQILRLGVQVLHVTGAGKDVPTTQVPGGARHVVRPYLDAMELAYAAADAVVTRAGAGMVSELSAVGLPALYVPLPIGNGEQRHNVASLVAAGGGLAVADADLDPEQVVAFVSDVLLRPERLAAMSAAAASQGHRDADQALAALVRGATARSGSS